MTRQTTTIDGLTFAYQRRGRGRPVVLLHGFPLDGDMWRAQLDSLSATCDVIVPDLRGFGRSEQADGDSESGVTMQQYADDTVALLDALQVTMPVALAGFSMGGYAAWQFALHHPQRLRGLALCDTRAAADTADARENRERMAEETLANNDSATTLAMLPKLLAPSAAPAVVEEVREMMIRQSPAAIAAAQRGMAQRPDVQGRLGEIRCPALVVVGADDAISPPEEMREIANSLPAGRFVEIANAGHMCPLENPAAVNAVLREFAA